MLECVIFDFDGTLADTLPLIMVAFKRAAAPVINRTLSDAEIIGWFGKTEEGIISSLVPPEQYAATLAQYHALYKEMHTMCPEPFPGVVQLIQTLRDKGICVCLVTGKGEVSARISMDFYGMKDLFDQEEFGSPAGTRKVEAIRAILTTQQVKPERTAYVGDAVSDITYAHQAGLLAYAAAWAPGTDAHALEQAKPDRLFHRVEDLAAAILV